MKTLLMLAAILLLGASAGHAQTRADAGDPDGYLLRPGDILRVRVWPDSTLGGDFPIEQSGATYLPLLGKIDVAGRSLRDFRDQLRTLYGRTMSTPVVTVVPLFRVTVLGAVMRPGIFEIDPRIRLFDAIGLAGGFAPDAKREEIRILRDGQVLVVNGREALDTGHAENAFALQAGDRIVVAERRPIRWLDILQAGTFILTFINLLRTG